MNGRIYVTKHIALFADDHGKTDVVMLHEKYNEEEGAES